MTTAPALPDLRYLAAADVQAAMPPLADRLALAERTLSAIDASAELPPKIGVHPRPASSFAHAMPAFLRGAEVDAVDGHEGAAPADRLGMKWVAGFPTNGALGLAAISALVVLNDAGTGLPIAILDGGPITAHRTAAVTGVAIARFGPPPDMPGAAGRGLLRVALLGAGTQGRSHVPVVGALLPGCHLVVHDRHSDRARALVESAVAAGEVGDASAEPDLIRAVDGADVVISTLSFGPDRQIVPSGALAGATLVVAVDYDVTVPAAFAGSATFYVDEVTAFRTTRESGVFRGYRDPDTTIGAAIRAGTARPAGPVLATHLGVGLADVVFGSAILERASAGGIGTVLAR